MLRLASCCEHMTHFRTAWGKYILFLFSCAPSAAARSSLCSGSQKSSLVRRLHPCFCHKQTNHGESTRTTKIASTKGFEDQWTRKAGAGEGSTNSRTQESVGQVSEHTTQQSNSDHWPASQAARSRDICRACKCPEISGPQQQGHKTSCEVRQVRNRSICYSRVKHTDPTNQSCELDTKHFATDQSNPYNLQAFI